MTAQVIGSWVEDHVQSKGAGHGLLRFSNRLPQCSRCRGDLIMSGVAPQNDEHGRPIHLELYTAGDADRPAASLLV
ncbi:DUF6300 family protein [Streptomyces griseorubiginosus]|uniref:DUF6300 family protein n=1 Tax=Streptomyces griseorubiginosus TaxID=67304 RepID=UPI0036C90913